MHGLATHLPYVLRCDFLNALWCRKSNRFLLGNIGLLLLITSRRCKALNLRSNTHGQFLPNLFLDFFVALLLF